ncbi:unnamed protein product [marine sediment metagenome]|uniref:Uncharacterized protein n=1 Tax=marine sediment metagenome TaxID=412755 RepID=X1VD96_9ZZZZ
MRARACIKCKEYMIIHANNPLNQTKIGNFERNHHQHTLITVTLEEIKDEYQIINNNGSKDSTNNSTNS